MKKIGFLNFIIEPPHSSAPASLHLPPTPETTREQNTNLARNRSQIALSTLYNFLVATHRSNLAEVQKVQEMRIQSGGNRLLQSNTLWKQGL